MLGDCSSYSVVMKENHVSPGCGFFFGKECKFSDGNCGQHITNFVSLYELSNELSNNIKIMQFFTRIFLSNDLIGLRTGNWVLT